VPFKDLSYIYKAFSTPITISIPNSRFSKGDMPLSDNHPRIAAVTGATSGFGEATARKFVSAGFGVVGNGRNAQKMALIEKELGPAFCGVVGDAADDAVLERLFGLALEHYGKSVDLVVVNAGRGLGGSVIDADLSQFEDLLHVNVTGALALMQKAARKMMGSGQMGESGSARDIVIIGSVVGRHVSPFSAVYGASKFAVHALTEGLRREAGPEGIRVSLVEPGMVPTGFQAAAGYTDEMVQGLRERFGPLPTAEDVANAIHYIVTQPPHVHVCDMVVRPTRQDYP
jgi:NADP-dependent 3-hydroxy acid dehydrogenase YdfG